MGFLDMGAYRISSKPPEKKRSIMVKIKEFISTVSPFVRQCWENVLYLCFDTPAGVACLIVGLFCLCAHAELASVAHRAHDAYVAHQQMCAVHNAWFTPSQTLRYNEHSINQLVPCRRLTNHSLFFIEPSGREMIPTLEYTPPQDGN